MSAFAHDSRELAEIYDRVSDLQFEGGKALFERLSVQQDARVLDIGCGTGRLARWIAERVRSVTAIDPVAERIHLARERKSAVRFEVAQAEDLSAFDDATFDAVCMSSVLHWVTDKAKALNEVRRVLRPGGRLGVTTLPGELSKAGTIGTVLEAVVAGAPYAGRLDRSMLTFASKGVTTTELVTLIIESGLDLAELNVSQRARTYASGAAVVDFMEASAFGTFLRPVPDDLRPRLRADLVGAFDAQKSADGVSVRGWGLRFVATRV